MPRRNPDRPVHVGIGDTGRQLTMFDIQPTPVGLGAKSKRRTDPERVAGKGIPQRESMKEEKPSWTAYNGPHRICDPGTVAHDEKREGAHLTAARYARTFKGERTLFCTGCATTQRAADGVTGVLPARRGRK